MKKYANFVFFSFLIVLSIIIIPSTSHAATTGYAWGENVGWIDFGSTAGAVAVTDSALSGYAYGENIGWIALSTVTNSNGTLSGYAWGENVGWINFSQVSINTSTGIFSGYAYGENIGWINFNTSSPVTTSWRPQVAQTQTTTAPSSSSGGSVSSAQLTQILAPGPATDAYLQSLKNCPAGTVCTPKVNTPTTPPTFTAPPGGSFTRTLISGQQGPDVKSLQQYLNTHGFTVSPSGAGSIGHETTLFGPATKKALVKFQKANGISATGFFGPITKAFVQNH